MLGRKIKISVLLLLFTTTFAFCQSEVLKPVVNNLAFYKQKKDLKYLANAKKSIDSLITTHADSADTKKMVYRAVVNSTIVYVDSVNTLKQPADFFTKTVTLVYKLAAQKRIGDYHDEMAYVNCCVANVYIRHGFAYMNTSDFVNAETSFLKAQKYAPSFTQLNFYIAYSSNKLGDLQNAAKYYTYLIDADSVKAQYVEAVSTIYKSMGDTSKALEMLKKGLKTLPNDHLLLLDEANIYNNRKDYRALESLLDPLLDIYPNNADLAFVAANCYDNLNQYDKAETYYKQAIDLNSSAYDPVFNLGLLYFKESLEKVEDKQKDTVRAIQLLEKANEISPNDVRSLQVLQLVYTETQNKNQLIKVHNKLMQLTNQ
jgi:tetratricopeptide (TPR) repeat protein